MTATATPASPPCDETRRRDFAARMQDVLNHGALALMTSIGHQTGLFDALAALPAATSDRIAREAGLQERYVREWLGAMVTGGVVEHDPDAGTYRLPPEHAASLTRAAGPANLATQAQFLPLLATVEEQVVACFRFGGGVPYSAFPRFHALMAEESGKVHDAALVDGVLPLVPGLVEALREGRDVLDVGCGRGRAIHLMARAFPDSRFVGYDFSQEAIAAARAGAQAAGLGNAHFEVRDVATLEGPGRFDLVTAFDAIHDQARPGRVLEGIASALRPDGVFLMVDIHASSHVHENVEHPLAPFLYTVSTLHCMTVSLALDGDGLGTMWGEQTACRMLREAGFQRVDVQRIDTDPLNAYYVARRA